MATAAKRTIDARTRSLELAQARGETACSWSARTLGWAQGERGELVSLALEIRSAHSNQVYSVGYLAAADDARCDCQASSYGHPCWHRGLAIICGREVARIYSPAGRAATERNWRLDGALERDETKGATR